MKILKLCELNFFGERSIGYMLNGRIFIEILRLFLSRFFVAWIFLGYFGISQQIPFLDFFSKLIHLAELAKGEDKTIGV